MAGRLAMVAVAMGLAVVLAGRAVGQEAATAATGAELSPLTRPIWVRRPNLDHLAKVYPRRLHPDGATGLAAISCRVDAEGWLTECRVVEESGPGFGDAALKLVKSFRMKSADQLGEPVVGRVIRVPFRLSPPR